MKHVLPILAVFVLSLGCDESRPAAGSAPNHQPSRDPNRPKLADATALTFFAEAGEFVVYQAGTVVERKPANDFRDGSMKFRITGTETATAFGNVGSADLELFRTPAAMTLTETTALGGKHVLTIHDEWWDDVKGFRAEYVRNVETAKETMRTTYGGYVKIQ